MVEAVDFGGSGWLSVSGGGAIPGVHVQGRWRQTPAKDNSVKKDLLQCQKRPITVSKETYYSVKRDLLQCQNRPITVSKETYYSVKREL